MPAASRSPSIARAGGSRRSSRSAPTRKPSAKQPRPAHRSSRSGRTPTGDHRQADIKPYTDAGVDWWIETVPGGEETDDPRNTIDFLRQRIIVGPAVN